MSKTTRNTLLIIFSILLIPLPIFWLSGYLQNASFLLEKLFYDDLPQVVEATFLPNHEHFVRDRTDFYNPNSRIIKQPFIHEKDHEVVLKLTEKNFNSFLAENRYVMVNFYASWCHWSQKLAPEYEAAAATLLKGDGVAFAKVDADTEKGLAWKYEISRYPTVFLFVDGVPKIYYGNNTRDAIVRWVRNNTVAVPSITEKDDAEDVLTDFNSEGLQDIMQAGDHNEEDHEVVVRLTEKSFKGFIAENQYVMVNFYASWCHWSQKLAPEYEAAAATLLKGGGIAFAKVDADAEKGLAWKYEISGYPTVFLFADGVPKMYDGKRTRDAIVRWVRNNTNSVPSIMEKDDAEAEHVSRDFNIEVLQVIMQAGNNGINEKDHDAMVRLTEKNFSSFIGKNEYVMVNFYASWCYWSKKLAPEYEAAAATLLKGYYGVAFAKVDADKERELARKYRISGYPTLHLFASGIPTPYYGGRTRDELVKWVRKSIAVVPSITNEYDAENFLAIDSTKVVGFYDTLEGPESKELFVASKLRPDIKFYQTTSPEVAKILHIDPETNRPVLVQLMGDNLEIGRFGGSFTGSEIANFLYSVPYYSKYRVPPMVSQYPRKESFETEVFDEDYSPEYN